METFTYVSRDVSSDLQIDGCYTSVALKLLHADGTYHDTGISYTINAQNQVLARSNKVLTDLVYTPGVSVADITEHTIVGALTKLKVTFWVAAYDAGLVFKKRWKAFVLELRNHEETVRSAPIRVKNDRIRRDGVIQLPLLPNHVALFDPSLDPDHGTVGQTVHINLLSGPVNPKFIDLTCWECKFATADAKIRFFEKSDYIPNTVVVGVSVPLNPTNERTVPVTFDCKDIDVGVVVQFELEDMKFTYDKPNPVPIDAQVSFQTPARNPNIELQDMAREGLFGEQFLATAETYHLARDFVSQSLREYAKDKNLERALVTVAEKYKTIRDGFQRTVAPYFCSLSYCPKVILHALFVGASYDIHEQDMYGYSTLQWARINKTDKALNDVLTPLYTIPEDLSTDKTMDEPQELDSERGTKRKHSDVASKDSPTKKPKTMDTLAKEPKDKQTKKSILKLNGYNIFAMQNAKNPELAGLGKNWNKVMGGMWKKLSSEEKHKYSIEAEAQNRANKHAEPADGKEATGSLSDVVLDGDQVDEQGLTKFLDTIQV